MVSLNRNYFVDTGRTADDQRQEDGVRQEKGIFREQGIAEFSTKHRLLILAGNSEFAESGVLMSYGPYFHDMYRRTAFYVDKILKGAHPADLPVEEPTKFELDITLKTVRKLGLTIPPSLLQRADQAIE